MPWSDGAEPRLKDLARSRISDVDTSVDLAALSGETMLSTSLSAVDGKSILVVTETQILSAAALIELDGACRRITIAPPDLKWEHLPAVIEDADIDGIVTDSPGRFRDFKGPVLPVALPLRERTPFDRRLRDTEWVLLTSGTSGRPKMVMHTLDALTGAIGKTPSSDPRPVWATFYDIRRYGGLQIFLRALLGGSDLVLTTEGEKIGDHLRRLGTEGVTSVSGTPSHWRRVLMSQERNAIAPRYIRLSGEIADQVILDGLRNAFPEALIAHAYASTEAGVGFAVEDGLEGFPSSFVEAPKSGVEMKIVEGSLRIRSGRTASRYLGDAAPALRDDDGFIDTGDLVERRGDRFYFIGRRGGIINVGGLKVNPEEVEAAINSHADVHMSLVRARKNPLTGAIVIADIVLRVPDAGSDALKAEIVETCRARLDRHKVPAILRFVPNLALTPGGKLSRVEG